MIPQNVILLTYLAHLRRTRRVVLHFALITLHCSHTKNTVLYMGLCKVAATLGHAHVAVLCEQNKSMVASWKDVERYQKIINCGLSQ